MFQIASFLTAVTLIPVASADTDTGSHRNPVQIYGHRGARALSPENTIRGYETALSIGVDYIDMDINMTKDGVLVVTHDATLNPDITRKDNGSKFIGSQPVRIKDLTFQELQLYDVGRINPASEYGYIFPYQVPADKSRIPSLEQVIRYGKKIGGKRIKFQIEIKTNPAAPPSQSNDPVIMANKLARLIEAEDIVDRVEVQAFDFRSLLELKSINPKITRQFLSIAGQNWLDPDPEIAGLWTAGELPAAHGYSIPQMIHDMGGTVWGVEDKVLTRKQLQKAKSLGLKVVVWPDPLYPHTEFNLPLVTRLIDWGVDGFISDRPDIIRGILAAKGQRDLPASCSEEKNCLREPDRE